MILGLDPGRDKIGWALVLSDGALVLSGIFPTSELEAFIKVLIEFSSNEWERNLSFWICERQFSVPELAEIEYIALGDGTGSREIVSHLGSFAEKTVLVNERGTTLAAREFYWRLHDPVWWQRFLPRSLRVSPRNLDDLAAWQIALRSITTAM